MKFIRQFKKYMKHIAKMLTFVQNRWWVHRLHNFPCLKYLIIYWLLVKYFFFIFEVQKSHWCMAICFSFTLLALVVPFWSPKSSFYCSLRVHFFYGFSSICFFLSYCSYYYRLSGSVIYLSYLFTHYSHFNIFKILLWIIEYVF